MDKDLKSTLKKCDTLFAKLDPELRVNAAARLFIEHCLNDEMISRNSRLAPLINTVADVLTKDLEVEKRLEIGVQTVQTYLRVPVIEFFGDTLIRNEALDEQSRDEMLSIKPAEVEFGIFLVEQGIITQDQRDVAIITQKRLMTIKEVYARLLQNEGYEPDDNEIIDNLKEIVDHFLISIHELEKSLRESRRESTGNTLGRMENIIAETEQSTHSVLEIVDKLFNLSDEVRKHLEEMQEQCGDVEEKIAPGIKGITDKLDELEELNMKLNESQGIQDRIGQQLQKIIPTIQSFHDQLMKVASKLKLNFDALEGDEATLQEGYGGAEKKRMDDQGAVDDLLSNLGL
ncbi:protein phosphatase CheZ [bacterium]|nr:protein phosphatase CheZ [bacterium]